MIYSTPVGSKTTIRADHIVRVSENDRGKAVIEYEVGAEAKMLILDHARYEVDDLIRRALL